MDKNLGFLPFLSETNDSWNICTGLAMNMSCKMSLKREKNGHVIDKLLGNNIWDGWWSGKVWESLACVCKSYSFWV